MISSRNLIESVLYFNLEKHLTSEEKKRKKKEKRVHFNRTLKENVSTVKDITEQ